MAQKTGNEKRAAAWRDSSLFSSDERAAFGDASQDAPQIYNPDNSGGDPATKTIQAGPSFGVSLHRRERFEAQEQALGQRSLLSRRGRVVLRLAIALALVFCAVMVLPDSTFNANNNSLSLAWFISMVQRRVTNITRAIAGEGAFGGIDFIFFRYVIVALAGAALAVSGAAYQGSLKNQLASPSTLGVMSGAQMGSVLLVLIAPQIPSLTYSMEGDTLSQASNSLFGAMNPIEYALAVSQRSLFCLAGSAIVVSFVLGVSFIAGHGRSSRATMVITGQIIAGCVSSFVVVARMYLQTYGSSDQIDAISITMTGGFGETFTLLHVVLMGIPIVICLVVVFAMGNKLNLLAFDEEEARSMGISTKRLRILLVACCTLLTAVIVAFCGSIGYVGFLIPHLTRRLIGPDFKYLLPASALSGAIFLLVVYFGYSNVTVPSGSISMITTTLGAIAFVLVLIRQRQTGNAGW